jgi:WD40 repeat protein
VASPECRRELEHAAALGKRIVPVLRADTEGVPDELASRQYVLMREGDDRAAALPVLVAAITTDLDWVRGHTRWLEEALRWEASGRDRGLLLRGSDLTAAEAWLVGQATRAEPRPTESQATFIQASRRGTTRRLQLTVGAAALAVAVAAALAGWALWQRDEAQDQRDTARSGSMAQQANNLLATDPAASLALAARANALSPTPEAVTALDEARIQSHQCRRIDLSGRAGARPGGGEALAAATGVEFLRGGSEILTAGPGTAARIWDVPSGEQVAELPASAGEVTGARVGAGGRVAILSSAGALGLWDAAGEAPRRLAGSAEAGGPVAGAAFSRAGDLLAVVAADGRLALRSARTGAPLASATPPRRSRPAAVAFSPRGDAVAVATDAGDTVLWRIVRRAGRIVLAPTALPGPALRAGAVAFTRSGRRLVSGFQDGSVRVWSVRDRGPGPLVVSGDGRAVLSIEPGRGETVVVAGQGGRAELVSARTGADLQSFAGHTGLIARVRVSPDGARVATASDDGTIRVFDARAGGTRALLAGHHANVRDVAFSADARRVASVGFDGTARVWDALGGASAEEVRGDGSGLLDVAVDESGTLAAFGSFGGVVTIARLDGGGSASRIGPFGGGVQRVAFVPGRPEVAAAAHDGSVGVYDTTSLVELWSYRLHGGVVYDVAPSPDGRRIATASDDGRAWVVDARTGAPAPGLPRGASHGGAAILSARIDRPGARLLTAGDDGTARLWDVATGAPVGRPMRHGRGVFEAAFSPDGRLVATAGTDGIATIWSASGARLHELAQHRAPVSSVVFSPSGGTLLTTGQDGTAALWDPERGELKAHLEGHAAPILRGAFSADGRLVATASEDGTTRIYDAATGRRVGLLRGARSAQTGVAITRDGGTVVTSSTDGWGRVYRLEEAAPLAAGLGPASCREPRP